MTTDATGQRRIAAVFDLRRAASCEALIKVVGLENTAQFESPNKPFVVLVVEGPQGEPSRLAFEDEERLLGFYLATLRINAKLEPQRRVQFVLRDLAPKLEEAVRQATQDLARELAATDP
jgi:hypothetical protein